jgi:hypothetical protein
MADEVLREAGATLAPFILVSLNDVRQQTLKNKQLFKLIFFLDRNKTT